MHWESRLLKEEDRAFYDNFCCRHEKGHILQSYAWGEIKGRSNWTPLRLMILADGEPRGAISILKRSVPLGRCVFYAPRGPVIDIGDGEALDFLLAEVAKLAKEHKAIYLKLDPDVKADRSDWQQMFAKYGFRPAGSGSGFEGVQPRYVFRLDITPDEDALLKNMHQKTRYNIRLAKKKGVTIDDRARREDLPAFYALLKTTATRDKFLIRNYQYFETMYDYLVPRGLGHLFLGYYEGNLVAGTFLFKYGDKAWYIYGASANEYRNVMPNYLIQWEMIRWSQAQGCTMYDFRGVPGHLTEDNPLYGLYKFKKGFNGEYCEFIGEYDLIYAPFFYKMYQTFEPLYYVAVRKWIRFKKKLKGGKE